jgi:hypothetical protein
MKFQKTKMYREIRKGLTEYLHTNMFLQSFNDNVAIYRLYGDGVIFEFHVMLSIDFRRQMKLIEVLDCPGLDSFCYYEYPDGTLFESKINSLDDYLEADETLN